MILLEFHRSYFNVNNPETGTNHWKTIKRFCLWFVVYFFTICLYLFLFFLLVTGLLSIDWFALLFYILYYYSFLFCCYIIMNNIMLSVCHFITFHLFYIYLPINEYQRHYNICHMLLFCFLKIRMWPEVNFFSGQEGFHYEVTNRKWCSVISLTVVWRWRRTVALGCCCCCRYRVYAASAPSSDWRLPAAQASRPTRPSPEPSIPRPKMHLLPPPLGPHSLEGRPVGSCRRRRPVGKTWPASAPNTPGPTTWPCWSACRTAER